MKYVLIVVIAFMAFRVDYFLGLLDKASERLKSSPKEAESTDIKSGRELIPMGEDENLKQTPKTIFLSLLEDFHNGPNAQVREKALSIFKENPTMFNQKQDPALETQIFRWRDLLNSNDPETVTFLLELMKILQGENLEMLKRFFSLWMDINMEHFVAAYSQTKDINCLIAATFGDPLTDDEKRNELSEREAALGHFLTKENIVPIQKIFAGNCLMVLRLEIAKLPPRPRVEEAPEASPEEASDPNATSPGVSP
jgi:hypothetical protein